MEKQEGVMVEGKMKSKQERVRRMRRKKVMVQRMRNGLKGKGKCEIILRIRRQ